jgi:hypothetical protein
MMWLGFIIFIASLKITLSKDVLRSQIWLGPIGLCLILIELTKSSDSVYVEFEFQRFVQRTCSMPCIVISLFLVPFRGDFFCVRLML